MAIRLLRTDFHFRFSVSNVVIPRSQGDEKSFLTGERKDLLWEKDEAKQV